MSKVDTLDGSSEARRRVVGEPVLSQTNNGVSEVVYPASQLDQSAILYRPPSLSASHLQVHLHNITLLQVTHSKTPPHETVLKQICTH